MPVLEEIHRTLSAEVRVLGINTDDRREEAQQFLDKTEVTYPSGYDPNGKVGRAYRLFGMPTTVIVSSSGRILDKINGEITKTDIQMRLERYSRRPLREEKVGRSEDAGRDGFVALLTTDRGSPVGLITLLALSFGFGAIHALGPGHGKTLMAAYVVGSEGRVRDAIVLGGVVAGMHTVSVLCLGFVLVKLDRPLEGAGVYLLISMVLGLTVAAVGVRLLVLQLRGVESASDAGDGSSQADHGHHHAHVHSHMGVSAGSKRLLSVSGLIALGASGGLFPSPSALILLVTAIAFDQATLGLALIGAFSVGLAASLSVVGVAIVYGRTFAERRSLDRMVRILPLAGGSWLVAMGLVLTIRSASSM